MMLFNNEYKTTRIADGKLIELVGSLYLYQEDDYFFLEGVVLKLDLGSDSLKLKILTPSLTVISRRPSKDFLSLGIIKPLTEQIKIRK